MKGGGALCPERLRVVVAALCPLQDPRPSLPSTTFFDPAIKRVVSRNRWAADATVFTYKASWMGINHQVCAGVGAQALTSPGGA